MEILKIAGSSDHLKELNVKGNPCVEQCDFRDFCRIVTVTTDICEREVTINDRARSNVYNTKRGVERTQLDHFTEDFSVIKEETTLILTNNDGTSVQNEEVCVSTDIKGNSNNTALFVGIYLLLAIILMFDFLFMFLYHKQTVRQRNIENMLKSFLEVPLTLITQ